MRQLAHHDRRPTGGGARILVDDTTGGAVSGMARGAGARHFPDLDHLAKVCQFCDTLVKLLILIKSDPGRETGPSKSGENSP
jgi:hypothetical protein